MMTHLLFHLALKRARKDAKRSVLDVVRAINVPSRTYCLWEAGERGYARDLAAELGAIPEIGVVSSAALSTARESALAAIDMA